MRRQHLLFGLVLTCACGGGADGDGVVDSGTLTCAPGEAALEGSLDGEAISHRLPLNRYSWNQLGPSTLDTSFEKGGKFHAKWAKSVNDGESFAATGTLTLPSSGPHGGKSFDYAVGAFTKLEGGVRFKVSGLELNVQCVTTPCPSEEVDGSLQGCVEPRTF